MHAAYRNQPASEPRTVTLLGSTGSIGCNAVSLIAQYGEKFRVLALTAHDNVEKLAEQAKLLKPELAVIGNPDSYDALKTALSGTHIRIAAGPEGLLEAAQLPASLVVSAIVGAAGLPPTLAAIRRGATIALANKECLVCAGGVMTDEVLKHRATLIPVDSEHNAIFQVFDFEKPDTVEKITITASGGPFRTRAVNTLADVTPEEAVKHPNWSMGAKISVDSATMMNKGLEVIEAYHLFPVRESQIEVIIHPESIIHSMVSYIDGSVLAQMSPPDMRTPIAYALAWPERMLAPTPKLDLAAIGKLTFEAPDPERFPCLRLARQALKQGGAMPTILNAANEIAVARFLAHEKGFLDIAKIVEHTLQSYIPRPPASLDDVIAIDQEARAVAQQF